MFRLEGGEGLFGLRGPVGCRKLIVSKETVNYLVFEYSFRESEITRWYMLQLVCYRYNIRMRFFDARRPRHRTSQPTGLPVKCYRPSSFSLSSFDGLLRLSSSSRSPPRSSASLYPSASLNISSSLSPAKAS